MKPHSILGEAPRPMSGLMPSSLPTEQRIPSPNQSAPPPTMPAMLVYRFGDGGQTTGWCVPGQGVLQVFAQVHCVPTVSSGLASNKRSRPGIDDSRYGDAGRDNNPRDTREDRAWIVCGNPHDFGHRLASPFLPMSQI